MILGYILICGMGPMEPYSLNGCRAFSRMFPSVELCQESRDRFYGNVSLKDGHYIDDSGCFLIGTGT
jgi:hypothetical protein